MKWYTISMFIYSLALFHTATLSFNLRFLSEYVKRAAALELSASCFAFHGNIHIITMHTSKISPKSLQETQSICSVCVAGTVGHLSLWGCRRIWPMCSRSPRLWLIIITGCWNNDFPSACSASRRTPGICRFFLWWLNTRVWIWGIKADLDTTKCAVWSSIQVINYGLARTVKSVSWITHNSAMGIVFLEKCDRVPVSAEGISFYTFPSLKTNDDCCTFLTGNKKYKTIGGKWGQMHRREQLGNSPKWTADYEKWLLPYSA